MSLPKQAQALLDVWWPRARAALGDNMRSVMLFGSVVRDDFSPRWSDVDVCVFVRQPPSPSIRAELARIEEQMRGRIPGGQQLLEVSVVPPDSLSPFARLQLAADGVCYAGQPMRPDPPSRKELAGDTGWLLDALAWDGAGGRGHSPVMLAGLIQEVARKTVFWRDGELVSKTAALQKEIEGGSAHAPAYALALRLRDAGGAACGEHAAELKERFAQIAAPARADLTRWINP